MIREVLSEAEAEFIAAGLHYERISPAL